MSTSTSNRKSVHAAAGRFASTQWSLVLAAGRRSTPDAEQALAKLCGAYWPPIYAYLRRRGYLAPEAEDLTQSFFVRLLEKNDLRDASPERGKFRSNVIWVMPAWLGTLTVADVQAMVARANGKRK